MFGDAENYERFMGRWSRAVAPLLISFADVPDEGSTLDAGSGTGSLAFAIASRLPRIQVHGVDPSAQYVAFANGRNQFSERVTFEIGDVRRLRFANGAFDASLSLFAINFVQDAEQALAEIRRVTRSGGSISAATWDYAEGMRMLRAFWDCAIRVDGKAEKLDERQMPLCRGGELSRLWEKAGLDRVREQPLEITMRFESFADYWDPFLLGQGPAGAYVRTLEEETRFAIRVELKRALGIVAEEEPFDLPARAWAVRGAAPG